jgi:hypothetical protein
MSLILAAVSQPFLAPAFRASHTLAAQRVTLRPSFMHSSSPRPLLSVLHIM